MFGTRLIGILIYEIIKIMKEQIYSPFGLLIDMSFINISNVQMKWNQKILEIFLKYFTIEHISNLQEIYIFNSTSPISTNNVQSLLKQTFKLTKFIKRKIIEVNLHDLNTFFKYPEFDYNIPLISKKFISNYFSCQIKTLNGFFF
jgi:hypothetical protein